MLIEDIEPFSITYSKADCPAPILLMVASRSDPCDL